MEDFFNKTFYGNTMQNWLISLGIVAGALIVSKIVYWFIGKYVKRITSKTKSNLDDLLVDKLEEPIVYGLVIIGFYWAFQRLHFSVKVDGFFAHLFTFVFTLNVTWLFVRTIDAVIQEYLAPVITRSESELDDQLLPMLRKLVKVIFWSLGIIIGLNNAGFDVAALIAGLGIGGLALALAAQDTVKNIFGGFMIFLDKPFRLSERIKIDGFDGNVEEIGVRSTRIRTLEGRIVTIPNAHFSESAIENVTREPSRKIIVNLGLAYETQPDKMEEAMSILREISAANENLEEDVLISFNNWGDFSLGIMFIYFIKAGADILETQTQVNMQILRRFNSAGLEFAYPTQTIYSKKS